MTYRFVGGDGYIVQQDVSGEVTIATTSPGQVICDYIVNPPIVTKCASMVFTINCVGGGIDGLGSASLSGVFKINSSGIITRQVADDNTTKAFNSNSFSLDISVNSHIRLLVTQTSANAMAYRFQANIIYDDNLAYFDPSSFSIDGWWRASFNGSPWTPTASLGGSASDGNLTAATAHPPTVGTAVNTLIPAVFDGVIECLTSANTLNNFITINSWSAWVLVNVTSIATGALPGSSTNDGIIDTQGTGLWWMDLTTSGGNQINMNVSSGSVKTLSAAITLGSWTFVQVKGDGTNLYMRVNNGVWQQTSCGNIGGTPLSTVMDIGRNPGETHFLNGQILEIGVSKTVLTNAQFDQIRTYILDRYGLVV